jgi:hypothetical protein
MRAITQVLCWVWDAVAIGRAQQPRPSFSQVSVELAGDVALVGDDQQPWPVTEHAGVVVQHGHEHLALVELGLASAQVIEARPGCRPDAGAGPRRTGSDWRK